MDTMDTKDNKTKRARQEYYKKYYIANREKLIKNQQEYYDKNRKTIQEKCCEYNKKYRAINHEKINKRAREMYWIKKGKEPQTKKYNKPKPQDIIKKPKIKPKIKDMTKLQKKTHDIKTALADLLVKKQEFIKKLEEENHIK